MINHDEGPATATGGIQSPSPADDRAGTPKLDDFPTPHTPHGMHSENGAGRSAPVPGLSIEQSGFQIRDVSAPQQLLENGTLSFRLTEPGGEGVTDYETSHDKDLHLIVVRVDGTQFRHVHPNNDGAGVWSLPWRWNAAGSYRLFADFVPSSLGVGIVLTSMVHVGGDFAPAASPDVSTVAATGDITVELQGALGVDSASDLTFFVSSNGAPVTSLEPYLGAFGHLVALREGDLGFLHVHPTGHPGDGETKAGPEISFMAQAPTAGTYFLYLDFQVAGEVHTAKYVINAARKTGIASRGVGHIGSGHSAH